jgi:hypothetical protein
MNEVDFFEISFLEDDSLNQKKHEGKGLRTLLPSWPNGIVLGFLWDKLRSDAGFTAGQKSSLTDNLKLTQWMIEHEDEYKSYIRVIKEIPLEGGLAPEDFALPGVNPWLKIGLWQEKCSP